MKRWGDERGAAAVEFALISSILMVILFAIIEFGIALNQYQMFVQAAREGARKAAVREVNDVVRAAVNDAVGCQTPGSCNGYEVTAPIAIKLDNNLVPDPGPACQDSTIGHDVSVSWTQQLSIVIPFIPDLSRPVDVEAVFRCE